MGLHHEVCLFSNNAVLLMIIRTEYGQHAIGCPGLDTPFEEWPLRNLNSEIYATAAMDCGKQTYMGLSDIVER